MTKKLRYWFIIIIILYVIINDIDCKGQIKGENVPVYNPDTVFVFKSPHPLINDKYLTNSFKNGAGIDVILSNNGFGLGFFYQYYFNKNLLLFSSLYISGARNTDEFETAWNDTIGWYVPNKVNRLFMFPLTFGVEQHFLSEELGESLKPFFQAGVGPTFIVSTPYPTEFFSAFKYARGYTRFSAFAGLGASLGGAGKSLMDVYLRYYYIPFGGNGLESISGLPIKDFGGIFLSLTYGTKF
ncbi:MAG: hypothetical protein ABSG15_12910 [FCB group bacterium]|jgi:hypothetical protein